MKYIFYHGNCMDGFGAAFAAWKALGDDGVKYIPVAYGKENVITDQPFEEADEVYSLDYSLPNEIYEDLLDRVSKVVMLDHHRTAMDNFTSISPFPADSYFYKKDNAYVLFDMNKSGAKLSFEYFNPNANISIPMLYQYIEDRDLWRFNFSGTKAFHASLSNIPMTFKDWDNLPPLQKMFDEGDTVLKTVDKIVDSICKKAYFTSIGGHMIPIVNATSHWSEVGNKLLDIYPTAEFSASYGDQPDGTRLYSLRSRDGTFDVSRIAALYGGGGHRGAAGFKVKIDLQLPQLLLEKT